MKPQAVMLKVQPMDSNYQELEPPFEFPAVDIDDIVFLRVPQDTAQTMKLSGQLDALMATASKSGKTFIILPEKVEVLKVVEKWKVIDK